MGPGAGALIWSMTHSSNEKKRDFMWWWVGWLEKAMAPHSSALAWKIPWMEKPGRLQSMGSLRVGHNWMTSLSLFTGEIGEGNGNPLQCSCLENPRDGGAWWAAVYGVAQSQTRLKWLSSSRSAGNNDGTWLPRTFLSPTLSTRCHGEISLPFLLTQF